jgi:hypothetical protein
MKMTRITRAAVAALLCLTAASPLCAADLAALGMTVLSSRPDGARTVYEIADSRGNRLTVVGDSEMTEAQAKAVLFLRDTLVGWKSMTAPSIRVTLSGTKAEALVVPSRYASDGLDLTTLIPSGLQFYLDSILEYDFRMRVGTIFLRMKGQFFDEEQLAARVVSAARDPIRFLESTDPEYLYRTLQEVTATLKGLESGGDSVVQSLRDLVADYQTLKAQKPLLEKKLADLGAADAALTAELAALASDYAALESAHDALRASHEDLARRHESLRTALAAEEGKLTAADKELAARVAAAAQVSEAEIARLRASTLALHNTSFLRGPSPMDPAMVARAVELKRANAAMTSAEVVAALKAQGITASRKQVDLIVMVYFPAGS